MRLTLEEARALAHRVVEVTEADQAEAFVMADRSALTRFANNRIHQNVAESNAQISVRAVVGKRVGVSSTNRLDDESLASCGRAAAESARLAPEDPDFPGLPEPAFVDVRDRSSGATHAFDADARARAVHTIIEESASLDLTAAGKVAVSDAVAAVANSLGVDAAMPVSSVRATVLSMGDSGGSGWASYTASQADDFPAEAIGYEAATLALRTAGAGSLEPGEYSVVLAPEAVAEIVTMLAYTGSSAKAVEEERSFMADHLGEKLFPESITIVDDALADEALGLTFDFEGMPKYRTPLIENGVVVGPVTDSYWASRTGQPNTGHALPAPNAIGPLPLDLTMLPGDATIGEMVSSVERGVYITRFHYVNVEDPVKAVLTGMTRDGTFLIESGRLAKPLKNLRFTQSAVEALSQVVAVGKDREFVGEMLGAALVPALAIEGFGITGQTE